MNWIDISILVLLGIGTLFGFQKGFIKSFAGFVGIGLAIWAGLNFSSFLEEIVNQQEAIPDNLVNIVALLATIGLVYVGIRIVSKIIHSTVHTIGLGFFNRIGGAIFGLLLYTLAICAFLYYILPFLNASIEPNTLEQSKFLPYLMEIVEVLKISFFKN